MVTLPESDVYQFLYRDGSPACFAEVQAFAALQGGTGTKILVFGGNGSVQTNGSGFLPRIARAQNWVNPELHLIDRVARRSATFPVFAWSYKLDWDRPAPFAESGAQEFDDVGDFLDFLVTRYSSLSSSSAKPTPLKFLLNRVGSPPEFQSAGVIFLQLQKALDQANQNFLLDPRATDINQEFEDEHLKPGRRMLWALSGLIHIGARTSGRHTTDTLSAAYLQMLQRIASPKRTSLRLAEILKAMSHALPDGLRKNDGVINELEDWALAGLLIFLAGLNAFGYVFESFDEPGDPFMEISSVTMVLPKA
ncbi:MAG: hypothetical protein WAN60_08035 [Candidatus Sulfotelmatobacter sp.]